MDKLAPEEMISYQTAKTNHSNGRVHEIIFVSGKEVEAGIMRPSLKANFKGFSAPRIIFTLVRLVNRTN